MEREIEGGREQGRKERKNEEVLDFSNSRETVL